MESASSKTSRAVLVTMCVGYFLVLLDVTIVNVALPSIGSATHAGTEGLQWVVDGYAVALASLMLAGGAVGDRIGHRRVVRAGLATFGIASLACGLAPGVATLVAARVLQGIGAALLLPGTLAIITRAFPEERDRARAIGVWASIGSIALPAGPLLGGFLVDAVGWRAVFLLNIPIVAASLVATARLVSETNDPDAPPVDVGGVVLAALGLGSLTFAVIDLGADGLAAPTVAAAAVALGSLLAFIAVERRSAAPMVPMDLLRRPAFTIPNAAAGVMNLATLGMLFVVSLFLQDVQGRSALASGLALLPLWTPLVLIAPFVGRLIGRTSPKAPMIGGLLIGAVGFLAMTRIDADSSYPILGVALLVWGTGIAFLTPAVVAGAIGAVERARAGFASAANNTARQAGGAVGIATFGAIAGSAAVSHDFVAGMHRDALLAAVLFVALALIVGIGAPARSSTS